MNSRLPIRAHAVFQSEGARPHQEDHALISADKGIFVVADGFGGAPSGTDAALSACESVRNFLHKEAGDSDATMPFVLRNYFSLAGNVLFNALLFANQKIMRKNRTRNVHEKGGASVIAGYLDGDLLALASVGSCSAWLMRGGRAIELVIPRTYGKLFDPFTTDAREHFNVPLMALGMSEDVEPEIFEYKVRPGDWLWFQTDGIPRAAVEGLQAIQNEAQAGEAPTDRIESYLKGLEYSDNASLSLVIF